MFENYTQTARIAIFHARAETSKFGTPRIESEQLLLGLLAADVPMLCAELIGAPRQLWGWIAILALPGTVAGVLIWTLLEHYAIARRNSN